MASLGEQVITGQPPAAHGAHAELMGRIFDYARKLGFRHCRVQSSRIRGSMSYYLSFDDSAGRPWRLRVSDHRRPMRAGCPHFDLVSRDGICGLVKAAAWLDRCAAGEVDWFDHAATRRRLSPRKLTRLAARWDK